jgi:glycoside/pentoside/hexuronide:cation symporter, GPH family
MSIPATTLVQYALPAVPLAALTLPLYIIVPTFYSESLGLPLAASGRRCWRCGSPTRSATR